MNIEQSIMQARETLHRHIDTAAETAQEEIRQLTASHMDKIRVQVGWMNRSAGQIRRYARAR